MAQRIARSKHRLNAPQRVLIEHILLLATALSIGIIRGAWPLSLIFVTVVTVLTVWRLLAHRSLLIVIMRSLEPLLIVWIMVAYAVLLELVFQTSWGVRSIVLVAAMVWQIRFFLVQFDPNVTSAQSLHSLISVAIVQTSIGLWLIVAPGQLWAMMILVWIIHYMIAHFWLERQGYHNSFVAASWALVAVELTWLSSYAITVYNPVASWNLLLTRSSLIIIIFAYAWGSMLRLHSQRLLTKNLVLEYGFMCTVVLIVLSFIPV
ncbi:MAG: hypothetical protein WCI47_01730 [bacterium]